MITDNLKQHFNLGDYEDIVVVDNNGIIVFYDTSNLSILDFKPQEILGKNVIDLYSNLTEDTSSLIKVLRTGTPIYIESQPLILKNGKILYRASTTFPIKVDNIILGALEFSKFLYTKDTISYISSHSDHKISRKNNTFYEVDDIITEDKNMVMIKGKLKRISSTDSAVLIYGQTGTGKELIAQSIHNLSRRSNHPFISLNCAAIPSTLLESIIFGSIKGIFTGAEDRKGLFETAQGGTIFLDEINSMHIDMQVKLLKAIEEKRTRRIGGCNYIDLDVRIIAAVNEEPMLSISKGLMREDLFYRLSVVQIDIPPLSQRKGDISILTNYFIDYYNKKMDIKINGISPDVENLFKNYNWPGNVRELRNIIEGAFNTCLDPIICINDIPDRIKTYPSTHEDISIYKNSTALKDMIDEYEKSVIQNVVTSTNGNVAKAANILKMTRQTLMYKIEKYNIDRKNVL